MPVLGDPQAASVVGEFEHHGVLFERVQPDYAAAADTVIGAIREAHRQLGLLARAVDPAFGPRFLVPRGVAPDQLEKVNARGLPQVHRTAGVGGIGRAHQLTVKVKFRRLAGGAEINLDEVFPDRQSDRKRENLHGAVCRRGQWQRDGEHEQDCRLPRDGFGHKPPIRQAHRATLP